MPKPRKRRTQTMAEKSGDGKLYTWAGVFGKSFTFAPAPNVWATIVEQEPRKWIMAVRIGKQKFHGERPTLDAAFKATANLIYKHAREYWLRMDGREVTKYLEDFLKGEI